MVVPIDAPMHEGTRCGFSVECVKACAQGPQVGTDNDRYR